MNIILLIIVGTAAGFLATRLMRIKAGIPETVAIGVGGALVGGVMMGYLLQITNSLAGFIGAILGTLILLWVWKTWIAGR